MSNLNPIHIRGSLFKMATQNFKDLSAFWGISGAPAHTPPVTLQQQPVTLEEGSDDEEGN